MRTNSTGLGQPKNIHLCCINLLSIRTHKHAPRWGDSDTSDSRLFRWTIVRQTSFIKSLFQKFPSTLIPFQESDGKWNYSMGSSSYHNH
jgi:hypothetical protein